MRHFCIGLVLLGCVLHVGAHAQVSPGCGIANAQPNTTFATMNANAPAGLAVGQPTPLCVEVFTDSAISLNIRAFPPTAATIPQFSNSSPVVVIFSTSLTSGGGIAVDTFNGAGFQMDIADQGPIGYTDQVFVDGYTRPGTASFVDATGNLSITASIPACTVINNVPICISAATFEVASQAIVVDVNPPFNLNSTGAVVARFTNGYEAFILSDTPQNQDFAIFNFLGGFTFRYYGQVFSSAFISSNGHISFGAVDTGFPNPNAGSVRAGVPRIMSFYTDLEPQVQTFNPRVYAQQFEVNGLRKIKFVHERLQEFGNATGPHGGEIIITENDNIAVLVSGFNSAPSINTAVGITPGNNVDSSSPSRNLSVDSLTGPTVLGMGKHGFELFDHGGAVNNPLDLAGFGFSSGSAIGPGLVFMKDPSLPNTTPQNSGYIVQ